MYLVPGRATLILQWKIIKSEYWGESHRYNVVEMGPEYSEDLVISMDGHILHVPQYI